MHCSLQYLLRPLRRSRIVQSACAIRIRDGGSHASHGETYFVELPRRRSSYVTCLVHFIANSGAKFSLLRFIVLRVQRGCELERRSGASAWLWLVADSRALRRLHQSFGNNDSSGLLIAFFFFFCLCTAFFEPL